MRYRPVLMSKSIYAKEGFHFASICLILNKLIKSRNKCNPKFKTYFSFVFLLRNTKNGK